MHVCLIYGVRLRSLSDICNGYLLVEIGEICRVWVT